MKYALYPEIEPFNTFRLKVSPLHEIFVEEFDLFFHAS